MANDGSVKIPITFDTSGVPKAQQAVESAVGKMENALKSLAKVAASVFAFSKLVDFGKQAIDLASDLDETQNVVDTAFGNMTDMVEAFADTAIEKLGLSRLAAKQMASTYMAMGKGIGVADEASAQMAINATARAADIMSFYNLTADRANTMMKSVWTGETESFKAIGVVMTEANLQNFAYQNGINKKISAMTEPEKVQLRYNYVMEQTALADGDFAKTSGSWANQVRMLSEKFKELLSILGTGLIQVLTPIVQTLNTIVSRLITVAQSLASVFSKIFGKQIVQETENIVSGQEKYADAMGDTTKEIKKADKAAKGATSNFDTLNVLSTSGSSDSASSDSASSDGGGADTSYAGGLSVDLTPIETSISNVEIETDSMVSTVLTKIEEIKTSLTGVFDPFVESIKSTVVPEIDNIKTTLSNVFTDVTGWGDPLITYAQGTLLPSLTSVFNDIATEAGGALGSINMVFSDLWNTAVDPFFTEFITTGLPKITEFLTNVSSTFSVAFDEIKKIFDDVWTYGILPGIEVIVGIFSGIWDGIKAFWDEHGQPIFDGINLAIQNIGDIFLSVWENYLEPIWTNICDNVSWLWENHLKPLWDNVLDFAGEIIECVLAIYNNAVAPVVKWFSETIMPIIATVINTVIDMAFSIGATIADVINGIVDTLKYIVKFIKDIFSGDWKAAWEDIQHIFDGIWNALVSLVKLPINLIIDLINGLINGVCEGINAVIVSLNTLFSFDVPDWIPVIGGESVGLNLSKVSFPNIPKLATGAVIPPNREFLAVLGDQKKGTNIEAPLDTMVQAFKAAAGEMGGGQDINVTFSGNEGQLLRYLYKGIKVTGKKHGVAMVK